MKREKIELVTTKAFAAFSRGDFVLAKKLYESLSTRISPTAFKKNLELCDREIQRSHRLNKDKFNRPPVQAIRIGCILDEFSFASFSPECEMIQLECGPHIQQLEELNPDLVFIESAWSGIKDSWSSQVAYNSRNLQDIIQWCKSRGIPTAFWNKEDPVHFETFINTAKEFDFIFTTDIDCVPKYKGVLKHNRVYFLPFSCQPRQLSPTEKYIRKEAFSFAGAYYQRYPERARDLEGFVGQLPQLQPLDIFDRNYGKNDPKYMFPDLYKPFIQGSLPYREIDKAYKGYTHSINLNSVKQSQSMFARRIFDLAVSNTSIISNYSRGLRLMFGDLIISTDDPRNAATRFRSQKDTIKKLQLLTLRKVLSEHTSKSRLEYILEKALSRKLADSRPHVLVISCLRSKSDLQSAISNYIQQTYTKSFFLAIDNSDDQNLGNLKLSSTINNFKIVTNTRAEQEIDSLLDRCNWVAVMMPSDYWGKYYLFDHVLATNFTDAFIIGKSQIFAVSNNSTINITEGNQYKKHQSIRASSGMFKADYFEPHQIINLAYQPELSIGSGYSIDCFNYCLHGRTYAELKEVALTVDDLDINCGLTLDNLRQLIDNVSPFERERPLDNSIWAAKYLHFLFETTSNPFIDLEFDIEENRLQIISKLEDKKHDYLYSSVNIPINEFYASGVIKGFLDCEPGLNIMIGFRFLDASFQVIKTELMQAGRNSSADIPVNTAWIKPCLRILGGGRTSINLFSFAHYDSTPPIIISKSRIMLVTNRYPSYNNLYQNAFIHTRLKEYKKRGCEVEVFQLQEGTPFEFREFEDIDIISGDSNALQSILRSGQHKQILIHFLSEAIWESVGKFKEIGKVIWIHGIDIQLSNRRAFLYDSSRLAEEAQSKDIAKKALWGDVFSEPRNTHLVFVSEYLANQTIKDYGITDKSLQFSIINNPIDDNFYEYQEKSPEQRKAILSIRPYNSTVYANDLAVAAVVQLSKESFFNELELLFVGDGHLFDETIAPLMDFSNVRIEKRFLRSSEIRDLHRKFGIFLVPSRMDTHGVSRDEAMASGLVPITNRVAAIPEFVDNSCGILAEAEDSHGLASGIKLLYRKPDLFTEMSKNAASRVRQRSAIDVIIDSEISVIQRSYSSRVVNSS